MPASCRFSHDDQKIFGGRRAPEGRIRLVGNLLYGAGLRLVEALQLRVKDVGWNTTVISANSEGAKRRSTILPRSPLGPVQLHLET